MNRACLARFTPVSSDLAEDARLAALRLQGEGITEVLLDGGSLGENIPTRRVPHLGRCQFLTLREIRSHDLSSGRQETEV